MGVGMGGGGLSAARLPALDRLRGWVMVLMAIDHASLFVGRVHYGEFWGLPLPAYDGPAGFLTRLVTHLAAPGFFFLLGIGVVLLARARRGEGWDERRIAGHLIRRGLLLILLQQLLENPAWILGVVTARTVTILPEMPPGGGGPILLHFGVLYALGVALLAGAALLRAGWRLQLVVGAGAILLTQLAIPDASRVAEPFSPVLRLLLVPGQTGVLSVFYPAVPWLGVAALGMAYAHFLVERGDRTLRWSWMPGLACLAAFAVLRLAGGFGNIAPAAGDSWIAFLAVIKYPPSLAFLLLTLGTCLVLLSALSLAPGRAGPESRDPIVVFGQTALAFYILHLYLYALLGLAFPDGASLPVMYLMWAVGLALLYPACLRYRRFKGAKPTDSIWRLF